MNSALEELSADTEVPAQASIQAAQAGERQSRQH